MFFSQIAVIFETKVYSTLIEVNSTAEYPGSWLTPISIQFNLCIYWNFYQLTIYISDPCIETETMSWPIATLAIRFARRYFPQIMLPITITVGFIGYSIESYFRSPVAPANTKSTSEMREERRLRELQAVESSETQDDR